MASKEQNSGAASKHRVKEKEMVQAKKGVKLGVSNREKGSEKKVDEAKQKKLEAIRARVEAQLQKTNVEAKPERTVENIMDFTRTGLSENDTRRKTLSNDEMARKIKEFEQKKQRLKERPIGSEETGQPITNVQLSMRESCAGSKKKKEHDQQKSTSNNQERLPERQERSKDRDSSKHKLSEIKHDTHKKHRHKHKSHKRHKEKHQTKKQNVKHSMEDEWVSVKKEASPPPAKRKEKKKKKAPPKGPPPMSFMELLSVAQENKKNPKAILKAATLPVIGEKVDKKKDKIPEPKRPMTQEEKERFYRTNTPEYRKWLKRGGQRPASAPCTVKKRPSGQVSGATKSRETVAVSESDSDDNSVPANINNHIPAVSSHGVADITEPKSAKVQSNSANKNIKQGNSPSLDNFKNSQKSSGKLHDKSSNRGKNDTSTPTIHSKSETTLSKSQVPKKASINGKPVNGTAKPRPYQNETNPFDKIYNQIQQRNPKPGKKRKQNVIESDDEYDEEMGDFIDEDDMDDFIDDSQAQDYSKYIKEIFGYDKRKYQCADDEDLSDMEVGFAGQMKEEIHSARIGKQEDLEDMRMEEEELKRKRVSKKKMRTH